MLPLCPRQLHTRLLHVLACPTSPLLGRRSAVPQISPRLTPSHPGSQSIPIAHFARLLPHPSRIRSIQPAMPSAQAARSPTNSQHVPDKDFQPRPKPLSAKSTVCSVG